MVKLSHTTQILSQVFKKPSSLCTVQDSFELPCTVQSEFGFLKTCDKIWVMCDSISMFLIF